MVLLAKEDLGFSESSHSTTYPLFSRIHFLLLFPKKKKALLHVPYSKLSSSTIYSALGISLPLEGFDNHDFPFFFCFLGLYYFHSSETEIFIFNFLETELVFPLKQAYIITRERVWNLEFNELNFKSCYSFYLTCRSYLFSPKICFLFNKNRMT